MCVYSRQGRDLDVQLCTTVCVYILDREGTWMYSSVSTALVVVNMDRFTVIM